MYEDPQFMLRLVKDRQAEMLQAVKRSSGVRVRRGWLTRLSRSDLVLRLWGRGHQAAAR